MTDFIETEETYSVEIGEWIEGSGWSCSCTIDNIPISEASQKACDEIAYCRFIEDIGDVNENFYDDTDYKIFIKGGDYGEVIYESKWASEMLKEYFDTFEEE